MACLGQSKQLRTLLAIAGLLVVVGMALGILLTSHTHCARAPSVWALSILIVVAIGLIAGLVSCIRNTIIVLATGLTLVGVCYFLLGPSTGVSVRVENLTTDDFEVCVLRHERGCIESFQLKPKAEIRLSIWQGECFQKFPAEEYSVIVRRREQSAPFRHVQLPGGEPAIEIVIECAADNADYTVSVR